MLPLWVWSPPGVFWNAPGCVRTWITSPQGTALLGRLNSPCKQLPGHHLPNVSHPWSYFGAESGKGWRCCGTWSLQVLLVAGTRTLPAAGDNGDIPRGAGPLLCNNGHSLPGQGDTVKRDTSGTGSGTRTRLKRKEPAGCVLLPLPPSTTSCHFLPPPILPAPLQSNSMRGCC